MNLRRRSLLGTVWGASSAAFAGCAQLSSSQTLRIGFVRIVNLADTPVDVQLTLSPTDGDELRQRTRTLQELNADGNSQADALVYKPSDPHSVSAYQYKLYISDQLVKQVDGKQVEEYVQERYTVESCVVLHFYINESMTDVSFSTELYEDCNLPTD